MNYVFLDISYIIFYRYNALLTWWNMAHPDDPLGDPYKNEIFVEKFKKLFVEKIKEIPKKLKINPKNVCFIGARDCNRAQIWRHDYCDNYKGNRVHDDTFMGGPFFWLVYNSTLLQEAGCEIMLYNDKLEADDCIALASIYLNKKSPESEQWLITNDMDYLQLARENVHIFNLKYTELNKKKTSSDDPQKDLFCKIVLGDKSDNIPGIFKKCGPKLAYRCYDEPEFFEIMLKQQPEARTKFYFNKRLIDFTEIPDELVVDFVSTIPF